MLDWIYHVPTPILALLVVGLTTGVAVGGFEATRKWLRRFKSHDGINDAISGILGALGVFYGVTVGLISIDVWQRHARAEDIVAQESAAIQTLYLIVRQEESIGHSMIPERIDHIVANSEDDLRELHRPVAQLVAEYLGTIVCVAWNEHRDGKPPTADRHKLRMIRAKLQTFEPELEGQKARYATALQALNKLGELRRLRVDAASDQLSWVMWTIIIIGALISMGVVYLFRLQDAKLHRLLVGMLLSFLGFVLVMIVLNNRPFLGKSSIEPDSYLDIIWIIKKPAALPKEPSLSDLIRHDRKSACAMIGHPG